MKRRSLLTVLSLGLSLVGAPVLSATSAEAVTPQVTIIAGTGTSGFSGDNGPATSAQLYGPGSIAIDATGLITEGENGNRRLRQIDATGTIRTIMGDGSTCANITDVALPISNYCGGAVVTAPDGTLYFADGSGIGRKAPGGAAYHYAGKLTGNALYADGGKFDVTVAPGDMAYDAATGNVVFIQGHAIRAVTTGGQVITLAGTVNDCNAPSDDSLPALGACLWPYHLAAQTGQVYFTEQSSWNGPRARVIDGNGLRTIAGNSTWNEPTLGGPATASGFPDMGGITVDPYGTVYLSGMQRGRVWQVTADDLTLTQLTEFEGGAGGLATDATGNLYISLQYKHQIAKITGLVDVPPPPPDGKQHGKVTSVSWMVTPTTKLWNLDVTVNTTGVSCPATLVISAGAWQRKPVICAAGGAAPSSFTFQWKVFNTQISLPPGQNVAITAAIAKSDAPAYGGPGTMLAVPPAPTLVGVGDSYLSGHRQLTDDWACATAEDGGGACLPTTFQANDPSFSWVTRMANKLNANVPAVWKFEYGADHLLARSGATTRNMFEQGQIDGMAQFIERHQGSWNVVAYDGGANNADFGAALKQFYLAHSQASLGKLKPWNVNNWTDCPDTQGIYARLTTPGVDASNRAITSVVHDDLAELVRRGREASSAVRFVDVLYPYSLKADNVCSQDRELLLNPADPTASRTWHGAASVVDELASVHLSITGNDILRLDLRDKFGKSPLSQLQLTRNYGYPHPDDSGQQQIANQATKLLLQN